LKLKTSILLTLSRDDLKRVVDDLDIANVDRRRVKEMRSALSRSRRATAEDLLKYVRKDQLQEICQGMGLPTNGKRGELVGRLSGNDTSTNATLVPRRNMSQDVQQGFDFNGKRNGEARPTKKSEKLTLARLERKLFEACDILRGNMDASEFKEYIFGMLFLKRMSDQFGHDREKLRQQYEQQGMRCDLVEKQLENPDKYDFFVPAKAQWSKIKHLKESVGSGLNKALEAIEDANPNTLQDVLKGVNFNRKVGQRTMDDSTLIEFIQHFDGIPLSNDDFEFPDLLGAAYEYLIKYFADSAGKKGGEFYTPSEVVRMMVQVIEPQEGMGIYDPCAGSGGMLIQSKHYIQETGGDPRNLVLAGQESNGGTWAICKMNMILHGIRSASIRQGDTLKDPQHLDTHGEIGRFDRVIANPPFSQNYSRKDMKFAVRFHHFMPENGKKADLMFVQHMVASLKSDGKMAVVMPHGVLFRGGEEKECRKRFIRDGVLEAVIGLPPGLFYGTGIPACVLVMNKHEASQRTTVLFINADREYKEGKNQNSLRPEDIEKITHVYHSRLDVDKYARNVPVSELEQEGYNLNIRRYVDNSPPPEPHDVRAHLHGGVPLAEVDSLQEYFDNYQGVRELLFQPRDEKYHDFATAIEKKDCIKTLVESAPGVQQKHAAFQKALARWWKKHVSQAEALPETQNVFELRHRFLASIAEALVSQGMLGLHQMRGAFAAYMNRLAADFKSVAASGWGPELIPEEDILQSQFPEVLEQIEKDQARIAELQGLFAAVEPTEEGDEPEESEDGVLPKELVRSLKDERKQLNGKVKELRKAVKSARQDIRRMEKAGYAAAETNEKRSEASDSEAEAVDLERQVGTIDSRLARHSALETEFKTLKANIRQVEKQKDELVAAARAKISQDEARQLIVERFQRLLTDEFDGYLRQYQRAFIAAVENLWDKYAVTTKQILAERDREATQLNRFLKELGYD
jgi:type I restriction enzyme M protein